jgi:hypothetical protein
MSYEGRHWFNISSRGSDCCWKFFVYLQNDSAMVTAESDEIDMDLIFFTLDLTKKLDEVSTHVSKHGVTFELRSSFLLQDILFESIEDTELLD